ncbi:ATP-binding protein [Gordonia sp. NPDC058843]|uniref:ATP-binding protein n=1 Tax=Gordonia sp. NPDC058843 TaxID=3346648 RepID=UPI00368D3BD8
MASISSAHRRPTDADGRDFEGGLALSVTSTPESAHRFRQYFGEWLDATLDLDAERRSDIVLAVYEAVANAAEHAYAADARSPGTGPSGPRSGIIEVRARTTREESLEVTVTDTGRWAPDASSSPYRGRGLALISALTDASELTSGPEGTSVRLCWHQRLRV